jgi:hypothetical protein
MRDSCEETFGLINKNLLDIDKESSVETLGKINIAKHLLDIKENGGKGQIELSQVSQVNIAQVDKWLIRPNLQLWSIITEDRQVGKDCHSWQRIVTLSRQTVKTNLPSG